MLLYCWGVSFFTSQSMEQPACVLYMWEFCTHSDADKVLEGVSQGLVEGSGSGKGLESTEESCGEELGGGYEDKP